MRLQTATRFRRHLTGQRVASSLRAQLRLTARMAGWSSFFSVIGSASAALLGLLFVSISFNAPATLGKGQDHSRRLAEQAFQNYLAVLMVALLALIPDMEIPTFGRVTLLVTAVWVAWVCIRVYQGATGGGGLAFRLRALRRHLATLIGYAMLVIAALDMALTGDDQIDWLAAAVMVLLFSAARVSWQFLVRIAATEEGGD